MMAYICVKSMTVVREKKVLNEMKNQVIIYVSSVLKFSIDGSFIFVSCKNRKKRQK